MSTNVDIHPMMVDVPLPKFSRLGEWRNPTHPPVSARSHLANQPPAVSQEEQVA